VTPSALTLGALGAVFWIVASRRAVRVTGVVLCWLAATALAADLVGDVASAVVVSVLAAPLVVWRRGLLSRPWAPLYAAGVVLLALSLPILLARQDLLWSHVPPRSPDVVVWTGSYAYESSLEITVAPMTEASDAVVIVTAVTVALAAWAWWRRSAFVFGTAGLTLLTAVHGGLEPSVRLGPLDEDFFGLPAVPGLFTPSLVLLAGAVVALARARRGAREPWARDA
jgi:hypothetical protein